MYTCLILHNMILKDEWVVICSVHDADLPTDKEVNVDMIMELHDPETHHQFWSHLVDYIKYACIPSLKTNFF